MARTVDDALLGRTIAGKFVLESFLGRGATGAVYRANQLSLDKAVAIKILHPDLRDATFVARFQREAKAASKLDHPNSMRVLDYGREADGLCYIAMELLDGRSLFSILREADGPLSDKRAVDLTRQILAALAAAHDMGVIHRDLKPENIIVVESTGDNGKVTERVKVCDFGMAKIKAADAEVDGHSLEKLSTQGIVVGTPEYMSPEQGKGEELDGRSDLYSVGIILYQMLAGSLPFEAQTHIATLVKHLVEAPKPPSSLRPDVHLGLEAVCLQAISKDREDRFATAREMRSALRRALQGERLSGPQSVVGAPESSGALPSMREGLYSSPEFSAAPLDIPPPPPSRQRAMDLLESNYPHGRRSGFRVFLFLALFAGGGYYAARRYHVRIPWPKAPATTPATVAAPTPPPPAPPAPVVAEAPPSPAPPAPVAEVTDAAASTDASDDGRAGGASSGRTAVGAAPPIYGRPRSGPGAPAVPAPPSAAEAPPTAAQPGPFDRATVSFGDVRTTQAAEADVVAAMPSMRFNQCYRVALRARGGVFGGVGTLHLGIGKDGHVIETSFSGAPDLSAVGKCIADEAAGAKIKSVRPTGSGAEVDLSFKAE